MAGYCIPVSSLLTKASRCLPLHLRLITIAFTHYILEGDREGRLLLTPCTAVFLRSIAFKSGYWADPEPLEYI